MSITHKKISGRAANADPGDIQPTDWDDAHDVTGLLGALLSLAATPDTFPYVKADGTGGAAVLSAAVRSVLGAPSVPALLTAIGGLGRAGDTLGGALSMGGNPLTDLTAPLSPNDAATKAYVDLLASIVSGALVFKGAWDASAGTFPGAGAAKLGWFYKVSVDGTVGGKLFSAGDDVFAVVNNASATVYAGNWLKIEGTITRAEVEAAIGFALGTAAAQSVGVSAGQVVQLDGSARLPAVDGSQLTGVVAASVVGAVLYNAVQSLTGAQKNQAQRNLGLPGIMRNYISGLTLSTAGASATFGVAAGVAADSTNTDMMALASAYTKTASAWAPGPGNGALDTSTIVINNWYYVYQIERPDTGVVDICISASPTAPTFGGNIPIAYTLFRRIGAILTDASSQWRRFSQIGDEFLWDVPNRDMNGGNINNSAGTLVNLLVPNQIKVRAFVAVEYGTAGTVYGLVTSPDQADTAAGVTNFNMVGSATSTNAMFTGEIRTNTSGQIRVRTDVAITGSAYVFNRGWSDTRGRDN